MANKVNSFQVQGNSYGVEANLTFDTTPTHGSSNPVTSNGIAEAIDGVRIGTDISYGRTPDTPVGFCSVSYGDNNIASADHSVVFGQNNKGYTRTSFISGDYNESGDGFSNILLGYSNTINGSFGAAIGTGNHIGFRLFAVNDRLDNDRIYWGFYNTVNQVLYADDIMTVPITLPRRFNSYIVDITNNPTTQQTPGTIYEYGIKNNGTPDPAKISKIINRSVRLTDYANNITYIYKGPCYYNAATDTNYSDSAKTNVIYPDGYIRFDLVSNQFIIMRPSSTELFPGSQNLPKWIHVDVYKGEKYPYGVPVAYGRRAYVDTAPKFDGTYHVYSSMDFSTQTDITNEMHDGEVVLDGYTGRAYWYRFNVNHSLCSVTDLTMGGGGWYNGFPVSNGGIVLGNSNGSTGSSGSIVSGYDNSLIRNAQGASIFGNGNTVAIGSGYGQCETLVSGYSNQIKLPFVGDSYSIISGQSNRIDARGGQNIILLGKINSISGWLTDDTIYIIGQNNIAKSIDKVGIFGENNKVYHLGEGNVTGCWNEAGSFSGYTVTQMTMGKNGIWTGDGVTYDPNNNIYHYATDKIFEKWDYWSSDTGYDIRYGDETLLTIVGYAISLDGSSLTDIPEYTMKEFNSIHISGRNNSYVRKGISLTNGMPNYHNYIYGSYNALKAAGCTGIGLVGYYLDVDYPENNPTLGALFVGSYNSMSGTTGAKFVVGVGDYITRKNGFIAYDSGTLAAPSALDNISAAASTMDNTGVSSDKMIITYGQLKSYVGPGGGGSSRPLVSIVTIEASDWSNQQATVSLSGVTENSIITLQPTHDDYDAYFYNRLHVITNGSGTITIGCGAAPTNDISVKVVYWV